MITKDPNAKRTYFVDWSEWLGVDTIASVEWTIPDGLTKISQTATAKIAYVKVGDGAVGQVYSINCHVVSLAGEEDDQTLLVKVEEK